MRLRRAGEPLPSWGRCWMPTALLQEIGVSCERLDALAAVARAAGALGAKLSGGARGAT